MKKLAALALPLLIAGCNLFTQPATAPATAPPPPPAATQVTPNPQFKNLQVLPKDLTRDQLIAIMRGFTQGLGVKCNFCHVVTATEPKEQLDFASDAKNEKKAARVMIQTTQDLNMNWLPRTVVAGGEEQPNGEIFVTCWTCHRGKERPEKAAAPAPPAPAAPAAPGR